MAHTYPFHADDCTGSTCMKWSVDGSLSPHDQAELLKRLCASDPALAKSDACRLHPQSPADR